jgi:quinoprotein glucose dehydrogenase
MVTRSLLFYASVGAGGEARLYGVDKRTGDRLGEVDLPAPGQYGMMTYMHDGRQHIVVQIAGNGLPGSLVALRLPQQPPGQ